MSFSLYPYQKDAVELLKTGSILCGGVGSGKSRTAIAYYFIKEGKGEIYDTFAAMKTPKDLYIITTGRKRDTLEWEKELSPFLLSTNQKISPVKIIVDSWNNISKYINVKNSFFIFDEQRLVGSGVWVKSFLKITKENNWILLTATPGDTWMDYAAVFIANGFYKNRTEFIKRHVVYNRFSKFPKIDHYMDCGRLIKLRKEILVHMHYSKKTIAHDEEIITKYDKSSYDQILKKRWNIFENRPVQNISELCSLLRKIVNTDLNRIEAFKKLVIEHDKTIIFYNFNYELTILREALTELDIEFAEWNGHKHEPIPESNKWAYLVQYTSGAEGWNCTDTNVIIFFSQSYSYKTMIQAAGRIDRLNTKFLDLYFYHLKSESPIDLAISLALSKKENFNESQFIGK